MLKIILSALLLCGLNAFAQLRSNLPKPLPITIKDLSQEVHPIDSSAVAAYTYRYGKTWFEVTNYSCIMVTEVYTRLKIYKKAGYGYANTQVVFYSGTKDSKCSFSDANTYNLVKGNIEKTPLNKDGEFEEELGEDFTIKKITMPNVREGSVVEYKYTIRTPQFSEFEDWYFQFAIPADDVRYDVFIPIYFNYNIFTTGSTPIEKTNPRIIDNTTNEVKDTYYSYKAKDVKAIKEEPYVSNIGNYITKLQHEIASVNLPNMLLPVPISTDWAGLTKNIYENEKFGRELKFSSYFEKDIDRILKDGYTPRQKADSIFEYVKNRMNWNEMPGFLCNKGVKKAYSEKTGNAAEINLMLVAMFRYAGLYSNPILVSTKSNGVALFPTRNAYNYVIASVKIDGKIICMDATSKYSLPDMLPERVLNGNGRVINTGGRNAEIDLMPKTPSRELINIVAQIDAEGKVSGQARDLYHDNIALVFRELLAKLQKADYVEKLEAGYKGTVISDYKVSNDKDPSKVLTEQYDFTNTMAADVVGGKIFFSPMLFFAEKENPFKSETRDYPIDFTYPVKQKHNINITLPEGYEVGSIPEPISLVMPDNIGSFNYTVTSTNNMIQCSTTFQINFSSVSADNYLTIRDFYKKMIDKQNEKVVLVKTENKK